MVTTKEYLRDCCVIQPQWLPELAPNLYKKSDNQRVSRRKRREKIQPLSNKFEEADSWRLSKRRG